MNNDFKNSMAKKAYQELSDSFGTIDLAAMFGVFFSTWDLLSEAVGHTADPETLRNIGTCTIGAGVSWCAGKLQRHFNEQAKAVPYNRDDDYGLFGDHMFPSTGYVCGKVAGLTGSAAVAWAIWSAATNAVNSLPLEEVPENVKQQTIEITISAEELPQIPQILQEVSAE
jgi:hypothetical protein